MTKPDLKDSIDELSPDQTAKILKDLAADAATKDSVVTAVQLAHEKLVDSGRKSVTGQSFLGRVSRTLRRKPKQEDFTKTSRASPGTIKPGPKTTPSYTKTNTASSGRTTPDLIAALQDCQVCDNCFKSFRVSMQGKPHVFSGCRGHPGRLEKLKNVLDVERLEQVMQKYAAKGEPVPDEYWTCCYDTRFSPGCNVLSRHVSARAMPVQAAPKGS